MGNGFLRACLKHKVTAALAWGLAGVTALAVVSDKNNLEITDIRFEPIDRGKNVVHVGVVNKSDKEQVFGIHIFTRSPDYGSSGVGWGTRFFDTIGAKSSKSSRQVFKIQGPVTDSTWLRLKFYNPESVEDYDYEEPFEVKKYFCFELKRRRVEPGQLKTAPEKEAEDVIKAFKRVQGYIGDKKYEQAWGLFTEDYQKAEFQTYRLEGFERIMNARRPMDSAFWWERGDFLNLQAKDVAERDNVFALTATSEGQVWTIDFVQDDSHWKVDWIAGYTPRILLWQDWEQRLLPKMVKEETGHFDIYYFKDSTAEKEIERIALQREESFQRIYKFLGRDSNVRIRVILFPDKRTKHLETGHQGAGWAFGNTIVEVYSEQEKVDPYHETTHILMGAFGSPPAMFNEGFATYMQVGHIWKGEHVDKTARALVKNGNLTLLHELIGRTEIGAQGDDGRVAYPESASFVKFLIDKYGKDKFLQAYGALHNLDDNAVQQENLEKLSEIYGKTLDQLEKQWLAGIKDGDF